MEVEIRLRGEMSEMGPVLAVMENLLPGWAHHSGSGVESFAAAEPRAVSSGLDQFVASATVPMLRVMSEIAKKSILGEDVARLSLVAQARLADEDDLNGVLGSIGRAWSKFLSGANPFLGKTTSNGVVYRIGSEIAIEISMRVGKRATDEGIGL